MTVGELIEELQKIKDKDLDVLTSSYLSIDGVSVQREPMDIEFANVQKGDTICFLDVLND